MGTSVEDVYIRTYENNVRHLAQQSQTRVFPYCQVVAAQSENHNWERMSKAGTGARSTMELKSNRTVWAENSRSHVTPDDDTQWSRRRSDNEVYNIGDVTEHSDIGQMLVDPNSNYARAHAMAMARTKDAILLDAATADNATDGDGANVALPASQTKGGAAIELSFDLVTEVSEQFMAHDIDPDEPKIWVTSPAGARKLLQMTEATSADYNALRPLQSQGYVENWMGYRWIVSTLLPTPDAGTSHYNAVMTQRAVGFQINKDFWVRIAEGSDISFAWRIYGEFHGGAVRVEDEHVVRVQLAGDPQVAGAAAGAGVND